MLQRAASNAYSWWWASHVRTKQSKWLEHNLQDMEEMVKYMLEIIDEDGDSFAKRAEMYYRRRPELISFVEEAYRAYRALAERYDHMSRELQNANRTIATVYPEQAQFAMDDEGEESPQVPKPAPSGDSNKAPPKALPAVPKAGLPKMPSLTRNYTKSFSRKGPLKRAVSTVEPSLRSGLSKGEALGEIDELQKGILGLQTEKEFVKSAYETGLAKYWDIENKITEMQGRVCKLQDEFGIGTVIEDDEARSLMAATALRSCQDSLSRLQAEQEQSAEEAKEEFKKIKAAYEKLQTLKNEPLEEPEPEDGSSEEDKHELELLHYKEKVKEELEMSSTSSLNMTEMAEKIDDVVNKVITLETVVTTRAALMKRLRSESRELQSHIQTLEEGNESLVEDSDSVSDKLKELEEELNSVKKLNKNVEDQNRGLQIDFVRATCTLDHLKEKLQTVKPDEDVDDNGALFQVKIQERKESEGHEDAVEQEDNAPIPTTSETIKEEEGGNTVESIANTKSNLDVGSETSHDVVNGVEEEAAQEMGEKLEEDVPNWRKLASNDFDEREKILLEEYSMILHDYREAKKKLGEVEKKKRDSLFESAMEIRELRNANALKDEEIQTLRQRLRTSDASKSDQSVDAKSTIEYQHWSPSPANQQQSLHELMSEHSFGSPMPILERTVTAMEEKLRSDIDSLLEENIDFWLRFSTSYHQITKFQTSIQDLRRDLLELNQSSTNTTKSNLQSSLKSDARPIYKHLREIQTELTLWLEQNALLKDELHTRLSSLCSIQEEIARASKGSSSDHQGAAFNEYQAAKFQGEVMNMKQENNKVAEELRSGFDRVRGLQLEMERMLKKMDSDFGFSVVNQQQHNHHQQQQNQYQPMQRNRVPLRSFLFGVKLKKQHQKSSIFSCINPAALHKPYSSLGSGGFPP